VYLQHEYFIIKGAEFRLQGMDNTKYAYELSNRGSREQAKMR